MSTSRRKPPPSPAVPASTSTREHVEPLADPEQGPGEGEDEDAEQVEDDEEAPGCGTSSVRARHHGDHAGQSARRPAGLLPSGATPSK